MELRNGKLKKETIIKELAIDQIENKYKELILEELSIILDTEISNDLIVRLSNRLIEDSYDDRREILFYHINLLESYNIA